MNFQFASSFYKTLSFRAITSAGSRRQVSLVTILLVSVFAVAPASARTINFGTGGGPFADVLADGSNISLIAYSLDGPIVGLGVNGIGVDSGDNDLPEVDNFTRKETIQFSFSAPVMLDVIRLGAFNFLDEAYLSLNGGPAERYTSDYIEVEQAVTSFSLATPERPTLFGLTSFGVNNIDITPVTAVPVPAAAWSFGSGLFALLTLRRCKSGK